MSVNVERREVESGDTDLLDAAWDLKERVRKRDDVLKQRRRFFDRAYERATVYAYRDPERGELHDFIRGRMSVLVIWLFRDQSDDALSGGRRDVGGRADGFGDDQHQRREREQAAADEQVATQQQEVQPRQGDRQRERDGPEALDHVENPGDHDGSLTTQTHKAAVLASLWRDAQCNHYRCDVVPNTLTAIT